LSRSFQLQYGPFFQTESEYIRVLSFHLAVTFERIKNIVLYVQHINVNGIAT
jgi:hypothetical protein